MDMGIGFSEILLVLVLILVFFGSKELPKFVRETARIIGKLRLYTDKVKRELDDITTELDVTKNASHEDDVHGRKQELRKRCLAARSMMSAVERTEKSAEICRNLMNSDQFKNAGAIMMYASTGAEVETLTAITEMLRIGKRIVLPYCRSDTKSMGIGEIRDLGNSISLGEHKIPEPKPALRDRFLRSDLGLIVCPGVGFDGFGGRLGRGGAYYDAFLRELKGKIPIVGLAFECQMLDAQLPFSYSDIAMDQIFTEKGQKLIEAGDDDLVSPEADSHMSSGL
jgi:5-formyltetrahydrofolate cyclo-ligase